MHFKNKFNVKIQNTITINVWTLFNIHMANKSTISLLKPVQVLYLYIRIDALRPSQQLWSCREAAFILQDFYPPLECHDIQNVF